MCRSACPAALARPSIYAAKRLCCGPGEERRDPTKQFYTKMFLFNTVILIPDGISGHAWIGCNQTDRWTARRSGCASVRARNSPRVRPRRNQRELSALNDRKHMIQAQIPFGEFLDEYTKNFLLKKDKILSIGGAVALLSLRFAMVPQWLFPAVTTAV